MWSDFSYRSQSGERAIERYMQQINASFSESEKDEIRSALAQHNSDIVTQAHLCTTAHPGQPYHADATVGICR